MCVSSYQHFLEFKIESFDFGNFGVKRKCFLGTSGADIPVVVLVDAGSAHGARRPGDHLRLPIGAPAPFDEAFAAACDFIFLTRLKWFAANFTCPVVDLGIELIKSGLYLAAEANVRPRLKDCASTAFASALALVRGGRCGYQTVMGTELLPARMLAERYSAITTGRYGYFPTGFNVSKQPSQRHCRLPCGEKPEV
ncbi:MAG: hypothetical protein A2270_10595 [Elusimicrobia bacterium RIFOXYA12_FULL_51_18]|nr:MAG: hypothetical protein A2270_10595 [Elusimicrobia bacterium RIFOXYA12_FULL_51_18]OGS29487.1 MAG: hypothetical protein A2218_00595 [Elusimicrobia bacterium RIFOXYA2_FULL_53_38]